MNVQDKRKTVKRKSGCNKNQFGSVRNINNKAYVDFLYLGERVRESSGLPWAQKNVKLVRHKLNKIEEAIQSNKFRFTKVFPNSKKKEFFAEKEARIYGINRSPDTVTVGNCCWDWYESLRGSGRITGRTLSGYKSHLVHYIETYFGEIYFADLNPVVFDKFILWVKKRQLRNKSVSNATINKIFIPLRMICRHVAIEYKWGSSFNPFHGFKKLPEKDPYENVFPLSIAEQLAVIDALDPHWKPYFDTAFKVGLRQGEQIAIKPDDIDWENNLLHIERAITRDEKGQLVVGGTKNKYSRRPIKLIPTMRSALVKQKEIYKKYRGEYFFCSQDGGLIDVSHLMKCVWQPALVKANIQYRNMKQTRHSFATNALSCGENPLWISKVLGHRNTEMVIKVYGKYIENLNGSGDGSKLEKMYTEA